MFRGFFTSNQNSKYFESNYFKKILNFLRENPQQCELKEVKNKLVLKHNYIQNINDILKFYSRLKTIQNNHYFNKIYNLSTIGFLTLNVLNFLVDLGKIALVINLL